MRGGAADVDRDVEDFAQRHTHKLALRLLDLIVKASQHMARAAAMIILDEVNVLSRRLMKFLLIEALEEKASLISEYGGFEKQHSRQLGFSPLHEWCLSSSKRRR